VEVKRFWILAGAVVITLSALAVALLLGSASFDFRRYSQHQGRLAKVLREQPTADRLTRGLADEGTVLLAVAATREEVEREASTRGGRRRPRSARRAHGTRRPASTRRRTCSTSSTSTRTA
jgi:hypothetical protein